jgi:hypothetical protein
MGCDQGGERVAHRQGQEVLGAAVAGVHGDGPRPGLQHPLLVAEFGAMDTQALAHVVDTHEWTLLSVRRALFLTLRRPGRL